LIDPSSRVRKEVVWALYNVIIGGSDNQIKYLSTLEGCLTNLGKILSDVSEDNELISNTLDILECFLGKGEVNEGVNPLIVILESCYCFDYLEKLTTHEDENISSVANHIIDYYFKSGDIQMIPVTDTMKETYNF